MTPAPDPTTAWHPTRAAWFRGLASRRRDRAPQPVRATRPDL